MPVGEDHPCWYCAASGELCVPVESKQTRHAFLSDVNSRAEIDANASITPRWDCNPRPHSLNPEALPPVDLQAHVANLTALATGNYRQLSSILQRTTRLYWMEQMLEMMAFRLARLEGDYDSDASNFVSTRFQGASNQELETFTSRLAGWDGSIMDLIKATFRSGTPGEQFGSTPRESFTTPVMHSNRPAAASASTSAGPSHPIEEMRFLHIAGDYGEDVVMDDTTLRGSQAQPSVCRYTPLSSFYLPLSYCSARHLLTDIFATPAFRIRAAW